MMDVVTGAFGYIGRYITRRLLGAGREVCTVTTHPDKPNPFGQAVKAFPYSFDDPGQLVDALSGAETLYNTYWIRFPFDGQTYESALENTCVLFECAKTAGVRRIVHIGVTRATLDSDLPYYRGKARQEILLQECGVPHSVVRPSLVFGKEDVLVNNIAWLLRSFPVFPIFGSGQYRVQPVFVDDLAEIAIQQASRPAGKTIDAIGAEVFTFEQMVRLIAQKLGRQPLFVRTPPAAGILLGRVIGLFLGDVILTRNELEGLMQEKLISSQAPNAPTRFSEWVEANCSTLGAGYTSEVNRHFRWRK